VSFQRLRRHDRRPEQGAAPDIDRSSMRTWIRAQVRQESIAAIVNYVTTLDTSAVPPGQSLYDAKARTGDWFRPSWA
jgi:hypothetical protein